MANEKYCKDFEEGDLVEVAGTRYDGFQVELGVILKKRSEEGFNYQAYDVMDLTTGKKYFINMFQHSVRKLSKSDTQEDFSPPFEYDDFDWYDNDWYDDWYDTDWESWREALEKDDDK